MKPTLAFVGGAALAAVIIFSIWRPEQPKTEAAPKPAPYVEPVPATVAEPPKLVEAEVAEPLPAKPTPSPSPSPRTPAPAIRATKAPVSPSGGPSTSKDKLKVSPAEPAANVTVVSSGPPPSVGLPPVPEKPAEPARTETVPAAPVETARHESAPEQAILRPDALEVKRAKEERKPETVTIPAGTILHVRISQYLSSERNNAGDSFSGVLDQPIIVNNMVIGERGARVDGQIVDLERSGRVKGRGRLSIRLTRLETSDRQRVDLLTEPFIREAESSAGRDATKVAIGAGVGAALGAIFGGGRGAAIGAATGGGAGAGQILLTRGKPAEIQSETKIPFRLREALTVTEKID